MSQSTLLAKRLKLILKTGIVAPLFYLTFIKEEGPPPPYEGRRYDIDWSEVQKSLEKERQVDSKTE